MTANNPSIGTCPCPIAKCAETCQVKRFRTTHTRDTGKRYAGKLYLICPTHGRLGMDGKDAMQVHIVDHGHLFNAEELKPKAAEPPPPAPPAPAPPAATAPAATEKAKPRPGWNDWEL